MKFLVPIIIIGAVLASQMAFASDDVAFFMTLDEEAASPSSSSLPECKNRAAARRAERLLKAGRKAQCAPASRTFSSSSSASARSLSPCTTIGSYRRALQLRDRRIQPSCDTDASVFHPGNSGSSSSASSSTVGEAAQVLDEGDTAIRSQFLLLGEVSPVLGAGKIFMEGEALDVTAISVNLAASLPSVRSLLLYDDQKKYLGRATLNPSATNRNYRLSLTPGSFVIGQREERDVYVRAQLAPFYSGGTSNDAVQISNIIIEGNGVWSTDSYTKSSSNAYQFPVFQTARSTITSVKNADVARAPLLTGQNRLVGSFRFEGRASDASAKIEITDILFDISQSGGVELANVRLATSGSSERFPCTVSASRVTCSSVPSMFGSVQDAERTLSVYADVTADNALHASLQLVLNKTGSPIADGAVTWTDGTAVFTWVAVEGPIAAGTYYSY